MKNVYVLVLSISTHHSMFCLQGWFCECIFCSIYFFYLFETEVHVSQAGFELTTLARLTLNVYPLLPLTPKF